MLTAAVVGGVVGSAWLLGVVVLLEGAYALPLERPYVLLQEARELGDGELPPAGRGLLWQLLLVPGASLADGAHAHLWIGLLSVGLVATTAAAVAWLAEAIGGPEARAPAVALTLANGWFLYAALAGTEALLVALSLFVAVGAVAAGRLAVASVALAALALAVPWGAIVAVAGAVLLALVGRFRLDRLAPLALPLLAGGVAAREGIRPLLEVEPATSVFRRPELTTSGQIAEWLGGASSAAASLAVSEARYLVPVLSAAAALLGGRLLLRRSPSAVVVAGTASVVVLLAAATAGWETDNARMLAALVPTIALAGALALVALPAAARRPASLALVALTALPLAGWWGDAIGGASQVSRVQLPFARETAANAAPGSRIAVDRPGVVDFFAAVTLDLSGRETPSFVGPARAGLGAVWEALERLPASERPDLLALSLDRVPGLAPTGLVGQAFIERRIAYEEERQPDTTHFLSLFAANWEPTGRAERVPPDVLGRSARTVVDVGDEASEDAAGYERRWNVQAPDRSAEVPLVTRRGSAGAQEAVSEGCRLVVREGFSADLSDDALLLARFDGGADLTVRVDGRPSGRLTADAVAETYSYAQVRLRAEPGRRRITVESDSEQAYTSCRYWVAA